MVAAEAVRLRNFDVTTYCAHDRFVTTIEDQVPWGWVPDSSGRA